MGGLPEFKAQDLSIMRAITRPLLEMLSPAVRPAVVALLSSLCALFRKIWALSLTSPPKVNFSLKTATQNSLSCVASPTPLTSRNVCSGGVGDRHPKSI